MKVRDLAAANAAAIVVSAMLAQTAPAEPLTALGTLDGAPCAMLALNNAGQVLLGCARNLVFRGGRMHLLEGVPPDYLNVRATAMNDAGYVVGEAPLWGEAGGTHAFLHGEGATIDLGTLGSTFSSALAINSAGQIIGDSATANGNRQAFLYSEGVMTNLGAGLPGSSTYALAINDAGQVLGNLEVSGEYRAFLFSDGGITDLGGLGGVDFDMVNAPIAINSAGHVIGQAITPDLEQHAYIYANGSMTDLGTLGGSYSYPIAIDDAGNVIGEATTAEGDYRGFFYSNGSMVDLGGSQPRAMSRAGHVVGYHMLDGSHARVFVYSGGLWQDLGTLGGTWTTVADINDFGQITGLSSTAGDSESHVFVFSDGAMTDLGTLDGDFTMPLAINAAGQVAGTAGRRSFVTLCPPVAAKTCLSAQKSSLQITDAADDAADQIRWKWSRGESFDHADLGDPSATASYRVCLYDSAAGVDYLVARLEIPPNPAWTSKAAKRWMLRDKTATYAGVEQVKLTAGASGKSQLQLLATGANIPMFAAAEATRLLRQDATVKIQLFNDATPTCWESDFSTAKSNTATQFRATTKAGSTLP